MSQNLEKDLPVWAASLLDELGLSIYDVELNGGVLRVLVNRPGGVGLDEIARLTRGLSPILDEHDPIRGHYTLEVSSPGLERRLRTPAHFQGALGETAKIKLRAGVADERRLTGTVAEVSDDSVRVDTGDHAVTLSFDQIESARTVFVWPEPAASGPAHTKQSSGSRAKPSPTPKKATS